MDIGAARVPLSKCPGLECGSCADSSFDFLQMMMFSPLPVVNAMHGGVDVAYEVLSKVTEKPFDQS